MSDAEIRQALAHHGLLLVTDPVLPSVSRIVARAPVKGSWWSHPKSHAIFAALEALDDAGDTLLVKLVSGKQTFVAESLWRDFFSIVTARARWQVHGLTSADKALSRKLDSGERVRGAKSAKTLEARLLAHARNVHTESGAHAKELTSWATCMKDLKFRLRAKDPERAKVPFEQITAVWAVELGKRSKLPWEER